MVVEKKVWYEQEVEQRRDRERHLKRQIQYNWMSFKQDESNHEKMVVINNQLISQLEVHRSHCLISVDR